MSTGCLVHMMVFVALITENPPAAQRRQVKLKLLLHCEEREALLTMLTHVNVRLYNERAVRVEHLSPVELKSLHAFKHTRTHACTRMHPEREEGGEELIEQENNLFNSRLAFD